MCVFAAFGAAFKFFGYDTDWMGAILSAGTFFGALVAGDIADVVGRCPTIITGCVVFAVGCILQMALKDVLAAFAIGCLVAGRGVGFISTIIIFIDRLDMGSYRMLVGVQLIWSLSSASVPFFLPDSPR
ncbi:hypothetical protein R3P38DRAFT_3335980 [Favolaschia claudopus]|uniref:Major facilitator superfamily (MFS) profile domain-containing protein n=1 Tax=Favolaschia claudopus TaxID=2862362 RepID=A0AAV9Z7A4_9AGAR